MKKNVVISVILSFFMLNLFTIAGCQQSGKNLKTKKDKVSYSIGVDIGNNLKSQGLDIDSDVLAKGLIDAYSGKKISLTDEEIKQAITELQQEMMAKQEEKSKESGDKNKNIGEEFLAKNKTKPGVKTLPSGLQYKIITEGTGAKPKATDTVVVNYSGTLIDGTEFDSSYKRGQPATFPVNAVIKGWTEALQLMKTGSKWELYIPSELAYGDRGAGNTIGPNSVLIFTVELIDIQKPASK
ncbi:MAG: hypothetical protein A2474_07775 [Elusimicrobia bacterium RIFOXYC2_FULL_34_12]|nr:MAG: hypothetical protein A2474_07775 [Elusimicrobia bacterium RIFOXYC2_FULL_34_12]OGS38738.1 MAG: hypothetical protein A2551_04610 [Elusimicrobia bacterium RIFOXYD2_FULL_34_30]